MTTSDAREIELLDGTIRDIKESLSDLMDHQTAIGAEIREKQERLRIWQARRAKLGAADGEKRARRAKGENERMIRALYKQPDVPAEGLSLADIEKRTGLPSSSVHAVVTRRGYVHAEGLWRPSPNGVRAEEIAPTTTP